MNAFSDRAKPARANLSTLHAICVAGLAMVSLAYVAGAQQQGERARQDQQSNAESRKSSAASELSRSNLSRVAASAGQIREVLVKDIGLMVELKRWIAKDASDNGQVVEDSSLTDEAILARLERDVEFRSYATLLLQRYGYLTPVLNPESDLGK